MRVLRIRRVARQEIEEAFGWYLGRSQKAARRFLDEVDHSLGGIAADPEQYPVIQGQLRRVLLHRFPYGIYFKIYPHTISVIGVIHGHRHPRAWLDREAP